MIQTIPVKETREQLADLINQVAIGGKSFIITKFGKPKAMLVPVMTDKRRQTGLSTSFGIWKDRPEMKDPDKWVRKMRKEMWRRHD